MTNMASGWQYSGYNSGHGFKYTWEWDFAPSNTVAQVSFYGVNGAGLHYTGVISYRFRPEPSGADQIVNVGDPWPPYVYVNQCSGVTFGLAVGAAQEAYILVNLFFW